MLLKRHLLIHTRYFWHPLKRIYDWLLPASCILCGYSTPSFCNICDKCQQDLPILPHCCPQCAQFLHPVASPSLKCGTCLTHPPAFEQTHALFPYIPPVIQLIIQLKFQYKLSHAQAFGGLLTQKIQRTWYAGKSYPDLIIPVPLHYRRLRERGFNQAVEIARPISRLLKIPVDIHGVKRIKPTLAQSGLSAADRQRNVENAFQVNRDYASLSVAVLDDVITTGHTIMEVSRLLKQNGAKRIDVWCCARRG